MPVRVFDVRKRPLALAAAAAVAALAFALAIMVAPAGAAGGVKDPGYPYVDKNNDGLYFAADGDVLLDDGEVADGVFDTDVPEGPDYTTAIQDSSLVVQGAAVSAPTVNLRADRHVIINTDVTATAGGLHIESRTRDVSLDDPTVSSTAATVLRASKGSVIATGGDSIIGASVDIRAKRDIDVSGSSVTATAGDIFIDTNGLGTWGSDVIAVGSQIGGAAEVFLNAWDKLNFEGATILGSDILLSGNITVHGADATVGACFGFGEVLIGGGTDSFLQRIHVRAANQLTLRTGGNPGDLLDITDASIADSAAGPNTPLPSPPFPPGTLNSIFIAGWSIDRDGATVLAGDSNPGGGGTIPVAGALVLSAGGPVSSVGYTHTPGAYDGGICSN